MPLASTDPGGISVERIERASREIAPEFLRSPLRESSGLSRLFGCRVAMKVEILNPIGSFKGRGTDWFVRSLDRPSPLVTASAGNFGQGLAWAARSRSIPLTVFAAENANPLKLARMREFGARVVLQGADFDDAKSEAGRHAEATGAMFVEDGREPAIAEGAGTIAVELPPGFDDAVIAVGNGAMINGMSVWLAAHAPRTRIVGVCADAAPAMERSWRSGRIETTATAATFADGIAVRVPVPEAVATMRAFTHEMLLVDDSRVLEAMRAIHEHTGLIAEPSGAVGVAAILAHRERFAGRSVVTVLCGGNVTGEQRAEWYGVAD